MRFLIALFLCSLSALGQDNQLTVVFRDLPSGEGFLMMQVLDEEENAVRKEKLELNKDSYTYKIDLPAGKYAIQVYHDENSNGEIDKNMMGVPTEEYGFSNNARGTFGPPDIEDQLVVVKGNTEITIDLD